MQKRPLLILSGTVMGTVGVLSYVPIATNAAAPLAASTSAFTTSAQASAPVTTATKATTTKAASRARTAKAKSRTAKSATSATNSAAIRKLTGATAQTPFGPLQVEITVQGTKIIGATALQTPQGGRSSQINQQAVPYLVQETLAAQSANIQGVSGATYTSGGWVQSLQSALSKI
ncbi:FMN-binding domain protein [mine drainage metagenome]|uniref:FMN-binding domain protein n=1 Tax=mine drainage metagenome TaxID=410659 RepID=A0A1J5QBU9_9ZZZZ